MELLWVATELLAGAALLSSEALLLLSAEALLLLELAPPPPPGPPSPPSPPGPPSPWKHAPPIQLNPEGQQIRPHDICPGGHDT